MVSCDQKILIREETYVRYYNVGELSVCGSLIVALLSLDFI